MNGQLTAHRHFSYVSIQLNEAEAIHCVSLLLELIKMKLFLRIGVSDELHNNE